jgi:hypothetical protein
MTIEQGPLQAAEVEHVVALLRGMAQRAEAQGIHVLWMVLDSAAAMIADGLEMHLEDIADAGE